MTPNYPGQLITVEGIDGAGKSGLVGLLLDFMDAQSLPCVSSFEPTHGPFGKMIRQSFVGERLPLLREIELFTLDRREHVTNLIRPSLESGKAVLLDRYWLSTCAYQGARGADIEAIIAEHQTFAPEPNCVLLVDVPPELAVERIRQARGAGNSFEQLDYLKRVRESFLTLASRFSYVHRIDGALSREDVLSAAIDALHARGLGSFARQARAAG